ncbi:MAG: M90 family metallopeptidase [Vicinamibacteria bacterium]
MGLFKSRAAVAPLSETDRSFLLEWSIPYSEMAPAIKAEFEDQVAHFFATQRITGVGFGGALEPEDKLLVAASACTLSCGWPGFRWTDVTEVLLYPDDFDRDFQFAGDEGEGAAELSGEAHPWGTIILSLPSLEESFEDPHDGYHVGYHEFAHVLDRDTASSVGSAGDGGLPSNISGKFAALMSKALESTRADLVMERSPLDPYGLESPAELWAVAVEGFFELSSAMAFAHPDLHQLLDLYFNQRPRN